VKTRAGGRRIVQLLTEAVKVALGHVGPAILASVVVAAMTATTLLTNGRVAGAQRDLLDSFDRAGGRVITVQPTANSTLSSTVLTRLKSLSDVEWAGAFGIADDMTNRGIPGGESVGVRAFAATDPALLGIRWPNAVPGVAFADAPALQALGLSGTGSGGLRGEDGTAASVVGQLHPPAFLRSLQPLVLRPTNGAFDCSVVVILASDVSVVDALTSSLPGLLASDVQVSASTDLLAMRTQVQGQVGLLGNGLVLGVLGASAVLVGMIQMVLVTMNRKDYGRRRALGARRGLIVGLVTAISLIEGMVGATAGIILANASMIALADPLPDAWFQISVVVLALAASLAGSIVPAWFASRRDPIIELRVP